MIDEQVVIECVRMVKVCNLAKVERQVLEVSVLLILLNENDFTRLNCFQNAVGDCGLARTCPTGDTNYQAHKKCFPPSTGNYE